MDFRKEILETDVLVIGGGTAGCFSALTITEKSDLKVIITDKANIKRSGCLAAGVNALNAYIGKGETAESFVEYVKRDSENVIREDLVYSIAKRLNGVTKKIEDMGLPILKDEAGNYIQRGKRSVKINGENIKPLLADEVNKRTNITVLNRVNIVDYLIKENEVVGAIGFSLDEDVIYVIYSKFVICATGGAAGIYKPNNPGFSSHKMWYSPFNTGSGYAMGIKAGAEMTSFEMRFIALRCKDTIAPTGTIAQGVKAEQINSLGESYVSKYGKPNTHIRLYATVMENKIGNGPCYLKTEGISEELDKDLFKAYLNMAPAQTLRWLERSTGPSKENVEIEGTEPYIVGGHTAGGYWIDKDRKTTMKGLYAIGDVAGGSPKKYVTGCFAEAEIAAESIIKNIEGRPTNKLDSEAIEEKTAFIKGFFENEHSKYQIKQVEEMMQAVMDEYAGGISKSYIYNENELNIAAEKIKELMNLAYTLKAEDLHQLMFIFEIIDRLYVSKVLIEHLRARKETRWRCYQENENYPNRDDKHWMKYVNSIYKNGTVDIIFRDLVGRDESYEHKN
ncbi:adenylyl-sulfate reductase subunit alpha [Clostridium fungisolvens]|uniref:Adenylylsulfate reductase subunit alpha n=1 Tax=Clostridium fungisolvens TaxID=1604897 RepID=A0A6V8ST86_9CLOT|nr:adenylyl-sulfate reductase subunit alpha [Clostridium fungisolvens]GFP78123.1 Adenylylsulfate reductase subunit alpha [Clostridium fungisolvens]